MKHLHYNFAASQVESERDLASPTATRLLEGLNFFGRLRQ